MARKPGQSKLREGTVYLVKSKEAVIENMKALEDNVTKTVVEEGDGPGDGVVIENNESMVVTGRYEVKNGGRLEVQDGGRMEVL